MLKDQDRDSFVKVGIGSKLLLSSTGSPRRSRVCHSRFRLFAVDICACFALHGIFPRLFAVFVSRYISPLL